jgi:hypothetical protein
MSAATWPTLFIKGMFLLHIAAALFMLGLIWFVQVVHYPLMGKVGLSGFTHYAQQHAALTTLVVAPVMLIEALTGLLLACYPPRGTAPQLWWAGLALLAMIWLATAFLSVPRHHQLQQGFQPAVHQALVWSNWLRTLLWSIRSCGLLYMLQRLL